jgi:AmmeMemoRadiSam system protein A
MSRLDENDKRALLKLARSAIASQLTPGGAVERPDPVSAVLKEKLGCFVTLHKAGMLRGCIGTIEATRPLVDGVEANARSAAFRDPRFAPVAAGELDAIDIEISLLTAPQPLEFADAQALLDKLHPGRHGVILAKGGRRATFLPQVWEQLPDKTHFLEHLCRKAGMSKDCWKDSSVTVSVYEVDYFGE